MLQVISIKNWLNTSCYSLAAYSSFPSDFEIDFRELSNRNIKHVSEWGVVPDEKIRIDRCR